MKNIFLTISIAGAIPVSALASPVGDLNSPGPQNLVWTNNVNTTWDIGATPNWLNGGAIDVYYDLDIVNFTDVGATDPANNNEVSLNTIVNPGAVYFNSSSNYILTGSGAIAGPVALTQGGSGTTLILTTNSYSGGTVINNGVLASGVPMALGNPSAALAVVSGTGTLDVHGQPLDATYAVPVQVSGNGYNGQGAIDNTIGGLTTGSGDIGIGTVQLTGDATVAASANWQIGNNGAGIDGNGYTLTKIAGTGGAGGGATHYLYLRHAAATPLGSFVIASGGVLFWDAANAVGATTPITLTNGGFIDTWDPGDNFNGLTFNNPIIVNDATKGGAILNFRPVTYNHPPYDVFNGNVYLQAGTLLVSNVNTLTGPTFGHDTFNGNISGPGGIAAIGSFTFINILNPYGGNQVNLNGVNTYTGPTAIYYGVYVNTSTASQGGGSYTVTDGGTLDVQVVPGHPTMPMSNLNVSDGFNAAYGANISFVRLAQMPTAPVIYATNFTTAYNYIAYTTIFPPGAGYTVGQFPLIQYNGNIGGYGFADLQLAPLPWGVTGYLSNNVTAHAVDLVLTAVSKVWTGAVSSNWDNSTLNWYNPATSSAVTFADNDAVTFPDNATNYNVVITRTNTPAGITVNSTKNYYWTNSTGGTLAGSGGLTKLGSGTLTIACANTFTGGTYIYGGTLDLVGNGSIRNSSTITLAGGATLSAVGRSDSTLTLSSGQTLRGDSDSSVSGNVVANIGATITPGGSTNIQYMTFRNNLTLSSGSTVVMDVSMDGGATNDIINVTGTNNYTGTLQLANSGGTPLAAGDSFKLFNNGQYTGNFATISGTPGAGLAWSFNPATGVATVTPIYWPITWHISGTNLILGWAAVGTNHTMQVQTNTLVRGLWTNWIDVAGSRNVTQSVRMINPANPAVFYRLK